MSDSKTTQDHHEIRKWAEERNGVPAKIKATGDSQPEEGILRIHFPEQSSDDNRFEQISWDDFFENFDQNGLTFLYQEEKTDGEQSTFHKFINA